MVDGRDVMRQAGTQLQQCSLVGGGARSDRWAQLMSDALDLPVITHSGGEAGGALGAARLGWLAAGGNFCEVCSKPPVARQFMPDAGARDMLSARLKTWRELYQQQVALRTV